MAGIEVSGIKELNAKLKAMSTKIKTAEKELLTTIAVTGGKMLNSAFSAYDTIDGNSSGNTVLSLDSKTISQEGSQVAYIEFGTGTKGLENSHEQAGRFGWKYAIGKSIRPSKSHDDKIGWYYGSGAARVWTEGLPAEKPAWNTAKDLRLKAKELTIEKIRRILADA